MASRRAEVVLLDHDNGPKVDCIIDVAYPIEIADVERARRLLSTTTGLSARDALHTAVMQAHDVGQIMSFARGFDGMPGLERIR